MSWLHPKSIVLNRNQEVTNCNLVDNYFFTNPRFDEEIFRRCSRMPQSFFLRIVKAVKNHEICFQQRRDGLSRLGLSSLKKKKQLCFGCWHMVSLQMLQMCMLKLNSQLLLNTLRDFDVLLLRYLRCNILDHPIVITLLDYLILVNNIIFRNIGSSRFFALEVEKLFDGMGQTICWRVKITN